MAGRLLVTVIVFVLIALAESGCPDRHDLVLTSFGSNGHVKNNNGPAITEADVGKTVRIEGSSMKVDDEERQVDWYNTSHIDCNGKIASVKLDQTERSEVTLEDGTKFDNPNLGPAPVALEVMSGCYYQVIVEDKKDLYIKIPRTTASQRFTAFWELEGEEDPPVVVFSWNGQCCGGSYPHVKVEDSSIYGDWGFRLPSWSGNKVFQYAGAQSQDDIYHCDPGCRKHDHENWVGDLYIAISTWVSYGSVEGRIMFEMEEPQKTIAQPQLDSIKGLYDQCCKVRQAPQKWDWEKYKKHGNTDTDKKPYCDWLPNGWDDSWGSNSCDDIPNIFCDERGNVIELALAEFGLKCALPDTVSVLSQLKRVDLSSNQLSGNVSLLLTGTEIVDFDVSKNRFEGALPCPNGVKLEELVVSYNWFTGPLPLCYTSKPKIKVLEVSHNMISGILPVELAQITSLVSLDISQNNLYGELPEQFAQLVNLVFFKASRNNFGGKLPSMLMQKLRHLFEFDISFNNFEGKFPEVGPNLHRLRKLFVGSNRFNGTFSTQFDNIAKSLANESFPTPTTFSLISNRFSGPLPKTVYNLTYSSAFKLKGLQLADNRFRCEKATGSWPEWALHMDVGHAAVLGRCTPVAKVEKVLAPSAKEGGTIAVQGQGFIASEELKCSFTTDAGKSLTSAAYFVTETEIKCEVPMFSAIAAKKGDRLRLSVANFGDDFASEATVQNYMPTYVTADCKPGVSGNTCATECSGNGKIEDELCVCSGGYYGPTCADTSSGMSGGVKFLIAGSIILVLVLVLVITIIIWRERRGKPLFMLSRQLTAHHRQVDEVRSGMSGL